MRPTRFLKRFIFTVAISLAICGIGAPTLSADTRSVSLTATPAIVDSGGSPGSQASITLQLTNNSQSVLPIHLSSTRSRARQGQTDEMMQLMSADSWVVFKEPDFILQPNEVWQITAVLSIPEDANPGGHYADLVIQPLSLERDGVMITTQPELAVQLLVSVAGDIEEELAADPGGPTTIITRAPVDKSVTYEVTNRGNVHTFFVPSLHIKRGSDVTTITAQPEAVLPGETRRLSFDLPSDLKVGIYRTQLRLDYGALAAGPIIQGAQVIVLPFNPIWLLALPAIIAVTLVYKIRRRLIAAVVIIAKGGSEPE